MKRTQIIKKKKKKKKTKLKWKHIISKNDVLYFPTSTLLMAAFFVIGSTTQKMKFSIKDFVSKCDQIHWKLRL